MNLCTEIFLYHVLIAIYLFSSLLLHACVVFQKLFYSIFTLCTHIGQLLVAYMYHTVSDTSDYGHLFPDQEILPEGRVSSSLCADSITFPPGTVGRRVCCSGVAVPVVEMGVLSSVEVSGAVPLVMGVVSYEEVLGTMPLVEVTGVVPNDSRTGGV